VLACDWQDAVWDRTQAHNRLRSCLREHYPGFLAAAPTCAAAEDLERAVTEFYLHPDAGIITSFPGLGALTGARVLAEIGDDRSRFSDAKGLKAYAGAAPITRASGRTRSVTRCHIKNNRLNAAGYSWAFSALTASPGARARCDRRRDAGDRHAAAQCNLFGCLFGCLQHCRTSGCEYDEQVACGRKWRMASAFTVSWMSPW
jgi:transposase